MPLTIDNDAHAGLVQPVSCVVAHGRPAVQGGDHRVKGGESARPPAYWSCPATNTAGGRRADCGAAPSTISAASAGVCWPRRQERPWLRQSHEELHALEKSNRPQRCDHHEPRDQEPDGKFPAIQVYV